MCVQEGGTLTVGRAGDQELCLSLFVCIFKGFSFIIGGFVTIAVFMVERSVPVKQTDIVHVEVDFPLSIC